MGPTAILYLTHCLLFLILLIFFVSLIIVVYMKYHDTNFFLGIFLSAFINFGFITLMSTFLGLGYFWLYISSFIFGSMAGLINRSIILSILSGAEGIFFSWLLPLLGGVFQSTLFGYYIIGSVDFYLIYIIPTISLGALGGAVGRVITKVREARSDLEVPETQVETLN